MGHVLNLIAKEYLFGQDCALWEREFDAVGLDQRHQLWRRQGELGKLHNLVAHVIASGKRTNIFLELQNTHNIGISAGKVWKLVLNRGIRWNASYSMIQRALKLRKALNTYAVKLKVSKDSLDQETFDNDYLGDDK
jgi:hypothetical protein